jgi:hypothetical protein
MREQSHRDFDRNTGDGPAGYGVKRSVNCDVGFLASALVRETLHGLPACAVSKGAGLSLIDRLQAQRTAAQYVGPTSELAARLTAACARLPAEHEGRIGDVAILRGAERGGTYRVAVIPDEESQQTLHDETRFLQVQIGGFALSAAGRYLLHATVYVTSYYTEAASIHERLQALQATEAQTFVLGAPFVKPIWT